MTLEDAYDRHLNELTRYLTKTFGEEDLARDAAQQAFSNAAFSLMQISAMPEAAVRAWLYAAGRNAAIDALRKRKRLLYEYDFDALPGAQGEDIDERDSIRQALETLNATQKELVGLRHIMGYNAIEIAGLTGMTAINVRYHLMTAMRKLKQVLKEDLS